MSQSLPADPLPALVQDADRLHELRELDAKVAEVVFGWTRLSVFESRHEEWLHHGFPPTGYHPFGAVPPVYSSDWSAIRLVEDEIERRGLTNKYADALYQLTPWPTGCSWSTAAAVLRASCEQRCKAALSVCGALHDRRTDA